MERSREHELKTRVLSLEDQLVSATEEAEEHLRDFDRGTDESLQQRLDSAQSMTMVVFEMELVKVVWVAWLVALRRASERRVLLASRAAAQRPERESSGSPSVFDDPQREDDAEELTAISPEADPIFMRHSREMEDLRRVLAVAEARAARGRELAEHCRAELQAIMRVLGVTLFKWLFDVDVSSEIESILEYDELFAPVVFGQYYGGVAGGARLAAIRSELEKKVKAGSPGKKFVALALERGMDAEARLQEVIWIVLFAAFGGTSNYAIQTVKHILRDPAKNIPLFRKNTEAFMLEAARVYPPVGGMNFMELREPVEIKTLAGGTMRVEAGEWAMSVTSGANNDPTVFDMPSEFRPGRANADRLMTWNAELRDIRAGTAPRGCPGTRFALRLATAVVTYFVDGVEKARGQAGAAQEL